MGRAVARRLLILLVSLLVSSLVIFGLLNLLPGDVATAMLGANATPDDVAALRSQLGLDRPWFARYLSWLGGVLHGDLGTSPLGHSTVTSLIAPRLGVTLWLVAFGMLLAMIWAFPMGMFAALRRRRWSGFAAASISQIGMAIPAFLAGIVLVVVFAVRLHWLPASGYTSFQRDPNGWLRHLVLPVLALAIVQGSLLTRYVRSAFVDVLAEDYYRTARSVGWTQARALIRHGWRNASLQVITVLGLQVATLFVGAIVIEQVFVLPGLGSLLLSSVSVRDLVVVQGIVMLLVALVLVVNAVVDVLYLVLDPRLRRGAGEVGS